jgi:hypothetical protein
LREWVEEERVKGSSTGLKMGEGYLWKFNGWNDDKVWCEEKENISLRCDWYVEK